MIAEQLLCECVFCPHCCGSGQQWFDISGEPIGGRGTDDLNASEPCEECGGRGISEICPRCSESIERDTRE